MSSSARDTSDEQQDEPTDDEPVADQLEPEPKPEPETGAEPVDETKADPMDESLIEEPQEQLTLDIIEANGLEVVNETTTDIDGGGDGGGDGTTAKEIKCVKNSQGQVFCYEELKPDEVCLKPIDEKDPPLCPPPQG